MVTTLNIWFFFLLVPLLDRSYVTVWEEKISKSIFGNFRYVSPYHKKSIFNCVSKDFLWLDLKILAFFSLCCCKCGRLRFLVCINQEGFLLLCFFLFLLLYVLERSDVTLWKWQFFLNTYYNENWRYEPVCRKELFSTTSVKVFFG